MNPGIRGKPQGRHGAGSEGSKPGADVEPADASRPAAIGQQLGGYRLESLLICHPPSALVDPLRSEELK
jgi:hypothetical protein